MVLSILLPNALTATFGVAGPAISGSTEWVADAFNIAQPASALAPMFTAEIDYWGDEITAWAEQYGLDPNLLATVMQIESCGLAGASSHAGAQGLFQVMPFHFSEGEVYTDPDTNAKRGANFLNECLGWSNGDAGLALACYNGGPSVINRAFHTWPNETQRYYTWGTGIYNDARANASTSETLDSWLTAGGQNLCRQAATAQGLR